MKLKETKWIKDLNDNTLNELFSKDVPFKKIPADLNEKIYKKFSDEIKNQNAEVKKKSFILQPALKYAFSFLLIISFLTVLLLIFFNIKNTKKINFNACIVKYINGNTYKLDEKTGDKKYLSVGDRLNENDIIVTEKNSNIELEINENSIVMVNERSKLKTLKLFKDNKVKKTVLELLTGEIFNNVDKLNFGSSFEVKTNTVTVGVRGTKFKVSALEKNNVSVKVFEGQVYAKVNISKEVNDVLNKLNSFNVQKVNKILEEEKTIQLNESLNVDYEEYEKTNNEKINILNTVISSKENSENYIIDDKLLNKIIKINNNFIKIEKLNKEEKIKLDEESKKINFIEKQINNAKNEKDPEKNREDNLRFKVGVDENFSNIIIDNYRVLNSFKIKSDLSGKKDIYTYLNDSLGTGSFYSPDFFGLHKDIKHIDIENDNIVGNYFKLIMHLDQDKQKSTDGKIHNRTQIKLTKSSPKEALAYNGNIFRYYFKIKLNKEMSLSKHETEFFGIAPMNIVGNVSVFLIYMAGKKSNNNDVLQIFYNPNNNKAVIGEMNWPSISGKWIQVECFIKYGNKGYLKFTIKDLSGNNLLSIEKNNIQMWKQNTSFFYPDWQINRIIDESDTFNSNEEEVDFADLTIEKIEVK